MVTFQQRPAIRWNPGITAASSAAEIDVASLNSTPCRQPFLAYEIDRPLEDPPTIPEMPSHFRGSCLSDTPSHPLHSRAQRFVPFLQGVLAEHFGITLERLPTPDRIVCDPNGAAFEMVHAPAVAKVHAFYCVINERSAQFADHVLQDITLWPMIAHELMHLMSFCGVPYPGSIPIRSGIEQDPNFRIMNEVLTEIISLATRQAMEHPDRDRRVQIAADLICRFGTALNDETLDDRALRASWMWPAYDFFRHLHNGLATFYKITPADIMTTVVRSYFSGSNDFYQLVDTAYNWWVVEKIARLHIHHDVPGRGDFTDPDPGIVDHFRRPASS